jgi:hypothetical protein
MKSTEGEPDDVWYKDETNEFQEQLKAYEHIVRTSSTLVSSDRTIDIRDLIDCLVLVE